MTYFRCFKPWRACITCPLYNECDRADMHGGLVMAGCASLFIGVVLLAFVVWVFSRIV